MKKTVLTIAVWALLATLAWAECRNTTIISKGRTTVCVTCCVDGGSCTVTCL